MYIIVKLYAESEWFSARSLYLTPQKLLVHSDLEMSLHFLSTFFFKLLSKRYAVNALTTIEFS